MAKPYDDGLKQLVRANPLAFVLWLIPRAQFVRDRPYELKNWKLEVDSLIEVIVDGVLMLLHIEFQTYHDATMAERLLRYNVLIRSEYNLPVLSW
jgi:predicted transposase YdaD